MRKREEDRLNMKKLPNSEFEVMKTIWAGATPIAGKNICEQLNEWKPQTVLTLLNRLVEKGFIESTKQGRERSYTPLITEDDYLNFETKDFVGKFHNNSITSLVNTLYDGEEISEKDIDELTKWLKSRR